MRFLFATLANYGSLFPALGIARELSDQGHSCGFATDSTATGIIVREGFERVPRGATDGPSHSVREWYHPLAIAIQVKHLEYAIERYRPDVIVGQPLTLGAYLVSERADLPLAVLGLAHYLWPIRGDAVRNSGAEGTHLQMVGYLEAGRRLFGLPGVAADPFNSPLLGDLFLLQSVPSLAGDPARFPEVVRLVGSCLWEPHDSDCDWEAWYSSGSSSPLVYVQCGRSFDRPSPWPQIVSALAGANFKIAASVSRSDGERPNLPGAYVCEHLPQGLVLPRAQAVISTGNTTAVLGALSHGLPLVLLPGGGEQTVAAEWCAAAKVAVVLDRDERDPAAILGALDRVLTDPSYQQAASRLAAEFATYNGRELAASLIASLGGESAVAGS